MTKVALIVVSKAFRVYAVSIAFISSVNREGGGCLVLSRVAPCLVSWKCWMTTTADGGNPQTHRRVIVGRRLVSFVLLASNARQGLHPSTSS